MNRPIYSVADLISVSIGVALIAVLLTSWFASGPL